MNYFKEGVRAIGHSDLQKGISNFVIKCGTLAAAGRPQRHPLTRVQAVTTNTCS